MTAPQQEQQGSANLKPLEAYIAYRTLRHSEDQDAIATGLALSLYPLWAIQRFDQLDRSTPLWVSSVLPVVKTAYLQSQRVAAVYAEDARFANLATEDPLPMAVPDVELPGGVDPARFATDSIPHLSPQPSSQPLITFDEFPASDVVTSLSIQGNYEIKAQMPGPEDELMYNGLKNSSGAAIRQSMNGGRNVTNNLVKFDRRIIGYARYTDGNPCWFCALLASRGTVYQKGSFIYSDAQYKEPKDAPAVPDAYSRVAKVHDHCRCTLRPVYSKNDIRDAEAQFYFDQWENIRKKNYWKSNDQQVQIFREQYRPYRRPTPTVSDIRAELQQRSNDLEAAGFNRFTPQVEWTNRQLDQLA